MINNALGFVIETITGALCPEAQIRVFHNPRQVAQVISSQLEKLFAGKSAKSRSKSFRRNHSMRLITRISRVRPEHSAADPGPRINRLDRSSVKAHNARRHKEGIGIFFESFDQRVDEILFDPDVIIKQDRDRFAYLCEIPVIRTEYKVLGGLHKIHLRKIRPDIGLAAVRAEIIQDRHPGRRLGIARRFRDARQAFLEHFFAVVVKNDDSRAYGRSAHKSSRASRRLKISVWRCFLSARSFLSPVMK
ncbi:MAG: hypothetical protein BWY42_01651 [Candidatus Omnitrophica bacterium ADurb.Bin277]|nr:MAG: hypothetical protein BWY42_01651 [Candidatus Omnitrophica bacterium ADurb.Bin277]